MIRLRAVATVLLCVLLFFALWPAEPVPYQWGSQPADSWGPDTVENMQASADYIDSELGDGDYVFVVLSEYYSLARHTSPMTPRIYHLVSPQHGQIEGLNQTRYHDRMRDRFVQALQNGTIALLIMTKRTDYMLDRWPDARTAFRANFCRVQPTPDVYARNGVNIYDYRPGATDCLNRTVFASHDV